MTVEDAKQDGEVAGHSPARKMEASAIRRPEVVPGTFQIALAFYVLLTGVLPTIIQAGAFGIEQGASYEFVIAMISGLIRDLLLVSVLVILSKHPLGILHPLALAVVVWPALTSMPSVIGDFGGWAGLLAGVPVDTPSFNGLPGRSASVLWLAVTKYNAVQIAALLSTFVGFGMFVGRPLAAPAPRRLYQPGRVRKIMIGLIAVSVIALLFFVLKRGGLNAHLTSLGAGRFRELSDDGPVIVATHLSAVAIFVWIAAMPRDIRSPLFLSALALVTAAQFISNGSRGSALSVPLIVALIWAVRSQKIPWKMALLLVPMMFLSIGLLGAVRTSSWNRSTADQTLANTGWSESMSLAQKEVADRRAASASVPVVEHGLSVRNGMLLGQSYFVVVTAFIPRTVWKDKPRAVGSLYAQTFLGAPKGGISIPVSAEAEMYWNFGLLGVLLLSAVYGGLIRWAYNYYWRGHTSPFAVVLYVLFITSFQFSSDRLVTLEQQLFLLFLCYFATSFFGSSVPELAFARPGAALQPRGALSNTNS